MGRRGQGRATDLLGSRVDYVVKFNGGNNAGHTVVVGDEKYALHLLPSGILTPGVVPVIANGVVVDIEVLFHELEALSARGVDVSKLLVSANAHVITSYHRTLDKVTGASSASARSAPPAAASARPTPTRSTASASGSRTSSTRTSSGRRSRAPSTRRTTCW